MNSTSRSPSVGSSIHTQQLEQIRHKTAVIQALLQVLDMAEEARKELQPVFIDAYKAGSPLSVDELKQKQREVLIRVKETYTRNHPAKVALSRAVGLAGEDDTALQVIVLNIQTGIIKAIEELLDTAVHVYGVAKPKQYIERYAVVNDEIISAWRLFRGAAKRYESRLKVWAYKEQFNVFVRTKKTVVAITGAVAVLLAGGWIALSKMGRESPTVSWEIQTKDRYMDRSEYARSPNPSKSISMEYPVAVSNSITKKTERPSVSVVPSDTPDVGADSEIESKSTIEVVGKDDVVMKTGDSSVGRQKNLAAIKNMINLMNEREDNSAPKKKK